LTDYDKTVELIECFQNGDKDAGEELLKENTGLVWSIAKRFFGRGVDMEDLYQLGCVGFIKAATSFDTNFGTRFSTYAVPKISGEIRRFLRDDGPVKVSRTIKEKYILLRNAQNALSSQLLRDPTVNELSDKTGFTIEEIALVMSAMQGTQSLQRETGDEGFTLESVLGQTGIEEEILERISVREAVSSLEEREKAVINLRYYHSLTQEKTAKVLGVSQVQVSRIERKAVNSLRELLKVK